MIRIRNRGPFTISNLKVVVFICLVSVMCSSCFTYNSEDIKSLGNRILMKDKTQFDSLVKVCNRVSINYHTCVIQIAQSFSNESYYYDNRIKDNEEDSIEWNISSEDKKSIAKYYTGDVYDIIIIKNLCVCLKLKTAYDKNDRVLQVIYVYDKNKFEQCYPTYTYPDKQNETISDKTDWVYFYDNHWAISPCSVFLQMDTIEIRKILTNEK